ncbi:MAG: PQQ-binding-like beta-propeller repeat protein [Verrucomicrobiaceae bacterium]
MIPKFPLVVTLLAVSVTAWMWTTDHVMRAASVMILAPFWLMLLGLWWALHRRGVRPKRLGIVIAGFAALFAAFRWSVRYEGSADGSALPSLAFRWQKQSVPKLKELHTQTAQNTSSDEPAPPGVADMPRFLGEKGDGVLPEPNWQTDWKTFPPREVWRHEIGPGWSGFAVVGRQAVTQEQRGSEECVTCYDIATGKLLWSHADKALFTESMGGDGPRATPTVDAVHGVVFTLGATGILNCLDLKTGALKWTQDVMGEAGNVPPLEWGKSASPLLAGDLVVCSGGGKGVSLLAFKRESGEVAWKTGSDGGSYSSPILMTLGGREQIVSVNRASVTGHAPADGHVLWSFEWPGELPKVCQPVQTAPDRVLITSSYGLKSHLMEIKADSAGKLAATPLWGSTAARTKFSSASVLGTHAYALDEGTLACVDLSNGERVWREGRYGFGQQVRVGSSWLLLQAEKGFVALIKASPQKLDEVSRFPALSSKTWNPPTLAGRWLLVRNDREAVCYEIPSK